MANEFPSQATRASLLGRMRDLNDQDSWEQFAKTYGPPIYHFCRRRGLQDSCAVDLVQEVLAQVTISIGSFHYDPSRGRFRDWLGAVVRSKLSRFWQANSKNGVQIQSSHFDLIESRQLDAEWASDLDSSLLQIALTTIRKCFDEKNWRAFEMTWIEAVSPSDVATNLGIPVSQVYIAKSRISKRLAEEIQHLSDDSTWLVVKK